MLGKPARRFGFRDDCEDFDRFARDIIEPPHFPDPEAILRLAQPAQPSDPALAHPGRLVPQVPFEGIPQFGLTVGRQRPVRFGRRGGQDDLMLYSGWIISRLDVRVSPAAAVCGRGRSAVLCPTLVIQDRSASPGPADMKTTMPLSGGEARRTRQVVGLALGASLLLGCSGLSRSAELPVDPEILQQLRSFATMGSVLYIAAHPDDENTRVITYLARGRGYRTAYLSLTRGDGGQNLLGPQFREQLGVARTQELLAARRLDGGRQYFTRAKDFGFSKDYQDTLRIWDRQAVLADIVRVIRSFRPDVVVTRFSPQPGTTHGHHTASTVLAVEAFKLAGDPRAFQIGRAHV